METLADRPAEPAEWIDATAALPDGRRLGYVAFGDPGGTPVLHFHGALMSRWEGFWLADAARACGIRLISVDRPGIGNSDLAPGRKITDWPADVSRLATALSIDRFAVLGVSGGGPYALACAAAMPERVHRVLLVAGAAPLSDPEVFALLSRRQQLVLGPMIHRPALMRTFIYALSVMPDLMRVLVLGAALGGLSPADLRLIRGTDLGREMARMPREARQAPYGKTVQGPAWDGHLHSQAWGFDLATVRVPVDLWYAEDDRIVPARMGRYLASRLPVTTARFLPDDGHISLIIGRAGEYLRELDRSIRGSVEDLALANSSVARTRGQG